MSELVAAFKDINQKAEAFRKESQATIRRVVFNLVLSVKQDGIVMTEKEASVFIADLADKAGGGQAKFLANTEVSQAKRILQCSIAEFAIARESYKGSDIKALADACPRVSNKGRKPATKPETAPKGETVPATKPETAPNGETVPATKPETAPNGETQKAAAVVLRSRLDFLLQITGKNKGTQWTAAHASAKAAIEALETLGL